MKLIDADAVMKAYPERNSLRETMKSAKVVSFPTMLSEIGHEICRDYCKYTDKVKHDEEAMEEWIDHCIKGESTCSECPVYRYLL